MLQVIATLLLLASAHAALLRAADSLRVEWMFENTFEKEYVTINEAMTVVPDEYNAAMEFYHEGSYRRAADILNEVRRLNLPDGELDFVAFVLAECYRKLGLQAKAVDEYRFVATRFSATDKRAPALYRTLEYAARDGAVDVCDSIRAVFDGGFRRHPLYNSVLYLCGKLYYEQERYGEAVKLLEQVAPHSMRRMQAVFLEALSRIQLQDWNKALSQLDYVWKHGREVDMCTEAMIAMGDIHFKNNRIARAMECYRKVPRKAARYEYALVKIARCFFDSGKFEKVIELGRTFLTQRAGSDYFFEMASILEQAYASTGREQEALDVGARIQRQIMGARITFEIFDEIDRCVDIIKQWQVKEYDAVAASNAAGQVWAAAGKKRSEDLQRRLRQFLGEIGGTSRMQQLSDVPHLAERRYLALLKKQMGRIEDTIATIKQAMESIDSAEVADRIADSAASVARDSLLKVYEVRQSHYREIEHEHSLIIAECLGGEVEGRRETEDMQAKFIDWEFIKYLEKKELLVKIAADRAEKKRKGGGDAPKVVKAPPSAKTVATPEVDPERLEQSIVDERRRLIEHIETMLDIYPKSRYAPAIMFRLAELRFDESGERFRTAMAVYEKRLIAKNDSGALVFPEYDLDQAIAAYAKITARFPNDRFADDAMFYRAMALQKEGFDDSAQAVMLDLIDRFPQSEFYIEANMHIGRYYFEHPKKYGGEGYKRAEEAFRNVLFYRDHPQFVQALYHLGWCYYMQDRYDEAIAAFKYMIEEVELEFDPLRKEETEVANPLLRAEAIDYLAISFDQDADSTRAEQFLKPIGNDDYASLVFSRMAELREEDLDFKGAIARYRRLIAAYPLSYYAPEAAARLIKLYENANDREAVAGACEQFFKNYSTGGAWQERIGKRDSTLLQHVDSMVIAIGLTMADNAYRIAETRGADEFYRKAAEQYRVIVDKYPGNSRAADAAWNLAAILDKVNDKPGAYDRFIAFSNIPGIDSVRRETAALNAVAIAQALLPPDSLAQKGSMDFAGAKLVDAVNNYAKLFPAGSSFAKVLLTMGGVYFNRRLFDKAAEIYQRIIDSPGLTDSHAEARLLLGQCRFGQERWAEAAGLFEHVWKKSPDETQRSTAHTFFLQSCYFDAKNMMEKKMFEKAAEAFKSLDEKFPGSMYGDIALFSAAEAWEKIERWQKACDRYFDLVGKYPQSKFAADALFNAAGDFEKADKFPRAAETYEMIADRYASSDKAKDALFNLGFCYEKMGRIDAMIAANERYSTLYPEEKDVEALLLRSANYYAKTGMFDKAINLYRNFIRRFPQSPKTVEAYYMIGKCQLDLGDATNARLSFNQTEQQNMRLVQAGAVPNHFYASEAALQLGALLHAEFTRIKLELPESQLKSSIKAKSELLAEASAAYQRVMQYGSEKMFEAACRMGELYEELTDALVNQERPKLDPIRQALGENDILTAASTVVQNSFVPYRKAIELAAQFDSLTPAQKEWVERSRRHLGDALLLAGTMLYEGVGAIQNAPVPEEIKAQPLLHYQYRIKLLETMEPQKARVLAYFTALLDTLPKLHLDDSLTIQCEIHVARLNFLIGSSYDRLAVEILKATKTIPKDLPENEREDLLFQLEDIVFELQDKALEKLETARRNVVERKLQDTDWHGKIIEVLARLNPEKYGASFYRQEVYLSDDAWLARPDSVANWNGVSAPQNGWISVHPRGTVAGVRLPPASRLVGGDTTWRKVYVWKNIFCPGQPRDATIGVWTPGKYKFFINGILTLSDTLGISAQPAYDSANGIVSLLKGGDNVLACELGDSLSALRGVAVGLRVFIDTAEHFSSSVKYPLAAAGKKDAVAASVVAGAGEKAAGSAGPGTTSRVKKAEKTKKTRAKNSPPPRMSSKEVLAAIDAYRAREQEALAALRRERLEIQKLRIRKEAIERKRQDAAIRTSVPPATVPQIPPAPAKLVVPATAQPVEQTPPPPVKPVTSQPVSTSPEAPRSPASAQSIPKATAPPVLPKPLPAP